MKCPNCRCIVPGNMNYCSYCGYEFSTGSAKTLTVEESYYDSLYYDDYYYDNYTDCFYNSIGYYNNSFDRYGEYLISEDNKRRRKNYLDRGISGIDGDVMFISIMVGLICLGIILSLLLLIV